MASRRAAAIREAQEKAELETRLKAIETTGAIGGSLPDLHDRLARIEAKLDELLRPATSAAAASLSSPPKGK
jgi:hypothetical protein